MGNGPHLVTRIARNFFCEDRIVSKQLYCANNLTLLGDGLAYPVPHTRINAYYDAMQYEYLANSIKFSTSFVLNLYRSFTHHNFPPIFITPTHPIYRVAETSCPWTVHNVFKEHIGMHYMDRHY